MSVKFTAVKCPSCGANLPIEEGRKQMYCSYCGASIIMTDENEHTYHKIDDAKVKHEETERIIRLKRMEIEEREREEEAKGKRFKIILSILLAIIGAFFIMVGFLGGEATGNPDSAVYMFAILGFIALLSIKMIWSGSNRKGK